MTKNEILSELFTSKDFNQCIAKMRPVNLQDELKAEVALILCEKPDEKIYQLYESGGLRFFTVRLIINLVQSTTSPFYAKFKKFNYIQIETIPEPVTIDYNLKKDLAIACINNLYWYDQKIMELYGKLGTYRAVEAATGIPFESIYKTVMKNCKIIREKIA